MANDVDRFENAVKNALNRLQSKWSGALTQGLTEGIALYKSRVHTHGLDSNGNPLPEYTKKYAEANNKRGLRPKILNRTGTLFGATNVKISNNEKKILIQDDKYKNGLTAVDVMGFQEEQNKVKIAKMRKSEVEAVKERIIKEVYR